MNHEGRTEQARTSRHLGGWVGAEPRVDGNERRYRRWPAARADLPGTSRTQPLVANHWPPGGNKPEAEVPGGAAACKKAGITPKTPSQSFTEHATGPQQKRPFCRCPNQCHPAMYTYN